MQSPHPPHPPYPPRPGPVGESDRHLVALLSGPADGHHHAVAQLLARHWRATRDYAVVCLATVTPAAQLVATAAFHRVLGGRAGGGAGGALRPQLLVAVRDIVRAWAADDAARIALPELRRTTGGRGLRAAKPGPPESRRLAARAFRALPGTSQCLLWHTEVEGEPINIPAGLLGVDVATATTALERAREQFRAGCVRAHHELAPAGECRFHNRLLDVPVRRGDALLPDARRHLTVCGHCRHATEQLGHFDGGLSLLLAETVLGWGARRYLDSRPGRGPAGERPRLPAPVPATTPPAFTRAVSGPLLLTSPAPASPAPASPASPAPASGPLGSSGPRRTAAGGSRRTTVVAGAGLASLALLATVVVIAGRPDGGGVPVPGATWGAPTGGPVRPGGSGARPAASPSAASLGGHGRSAARVGVADHDGAREWRWGRSR
ncbi:hydrolase [Streptomyces naphthomycinicus]|uniref:hydrolase n=1 Tax=Streptomyces naphthomycinicus TaxID=2872625 RepID=UPI0027E56895|nr:hydrolase [Streptomyces sp. TML10]